MIKEILTYQPPFCFEQLLDFFRIRAISGVEVVDSASYARCVRITLSDGGGASVASDGQDVCASGDVRGACGNEISQNATLPDATSPENSQTESEFFGYIRVVNDAKNNALVLFMSDALMPVKHIVASRVRAMFDLDCNPYVVSAGLAPLERACPHSTKMGTRLPGAFDAFETCCRAVLGQQISVAAANKLAARVASAFGTPLAARVDSFSGMLPDACEASFSKTTPDAGVVGVFEKALDAGADGLEQGLEEDFGKDLTHGFEPSLEQDLSQDLKAMCNVVWPTPAEILAIPDIEGAFGQLGVIKNRTRAITEIARLMQSGELSFDGGAGGRADASAHAGKHTGAPADMHAHAQKQMSTLLQIRGVGPWTANYILMRVASYPDAFLETDAGVVHALPNTTPKQRLKLVERCKPWRSYAVVNLWNSLGGANETVKANTKANTRTTGARKKNATTKNPRTQSAHAQSTRKASPSEKHPRKKNIRAQKTKDAQSHTFFTEYKSSLIGKLTIASNGSAITGCWFNNDRYFGCGVSGNMQRDDNLRIFKQVSEWFDAYFAGVAPSPHDLPLDAKATPFQKLVREKMLAIPYGHTTTYGDIAREIAQQTGSRACAQAVGGAVGHNPLCVIVPCHRVVGKNGNLTGFGGGIDMKVKLLKHEGADMSAFTIPTRGSAIDPRDWAGSATGLTC